VKKIFRKSLRDLLFHDSGSNTTTPAAKPRLRQQNHDSSSSTTIPAAAPRFRQQQPAEKPLRGSPSGGSTSGDRTR